MLIAFTGSIPLGFFIFMLDQITKLVLKEDAAELENELTIPYHEAFKLAVEIWKGESLEQIAFFLSDDGSFQDSIDDIAKAIKKLS
jgi:hypothetical protein